MKSKHVVFIATNICINYDIIFDDVSLERTGISTSSVTASVSVSVNDEQEFEAFLLFVGFITAQNYLKQQNQTILLSLQLPSKYREKNFNTDAVLCGRGAF